jgi:hypothetical protein
MACTIYKTKAGEYKMVAQCETAAGYLLDVVPIYILPVNCLNEDFLSRLAEVLNISSKKIKAPGRDEFPKLQKEFLTQLKERSFSKLYMKSSSCSIRVDNNILKIYPNKLATEGQPNDGLEWIEEESVAVEDYGSRLNDVVVLVREILNR